MIPKMNDAYSCVNSVGQSSPVFHVVSALVEKGRGITSGLFLALLGTNRGKFKRLYINTVASVCHCEY